VVPALVAYLQDQADGFQLYDQTGRTRLGIALEEAILNGIHHGNLELNSELREGGDEPYRRLAGERARTPPYSDRRLRLRATLSTAEAVFVIADDGPGFDPASLPDPTDPANLGRAFGRGLLLIRTFMDEVTFTPPGNQITLVKRRDGARGKTSCTS
jgi:anti-sigma regulatory factor (Ser/Thr protein kinase)